MLYDRKIKYVHMYENGEKIQNVGFVKLEIAEDKVNMYIHIVGLRCTNEECLVQVKGKEGETVLGKLRLESGKGSLNIEALSVKQVAEGIPYDELREIFMNLSPRVVLRCVIQEFSEEIEEEIPEEKSEEIAEELSETFPDETLEADARETEELSEAELLREAFVQERRMLEESAGQFEPEPQEYPQMVQPESQEQAMAVDKWQQLWALYPHMKPFEDGREYLVIKPRDFVVLHNKYYPLSANSFLLHGYYNYEHLIMCRETKKDGEQFYIGVPGNFYEKEKQVAVLFGFESFEGKREPAGNGDFGYYMVRVEI